VCEKTALRNDGGQGMAALSRHPEERLPSDEGSPHNYLKLCKGVPILKPQHISTIIIIQKS